jgi:CheY-like chemotaxis protein
LIWKVGAHFVEKLLRLTEKLVEAPSKNLSVNARVKNRDDPMSSQQNEACILRAKDNPAVVMPVEYALKEHAINCKLLAMNDGAEALRFFRQLDLDSTTPVADLVLLNLHLPKDGDEEIVRQTGGSECCAKMAVVVMSSSNSPNDRRAAERNCAPYFQKPSGLEAFMELGTVVKQALAEQPLARSGGLRCASHGRDSDRRAR